MLQIRTSVRRCYRFLAAQMPDIRHRSSDRFGPGFAKDFAGWIMSLWRLLQAPDLAYARSQ